VRVRRGLGTSATLARGFYGWPAGAICFVMSDKRTFATVRVPAFPEIVTYGKDEREALAMAEDAIRLVIEDSVR